MKTPSIVNVNIRQHGDGKRVYITVEDGHSTYTINADLICVFVQGSIQDNKQVNVERGRD